MKKILILLIITIFTLPLSACGEKNKSEGVDKGKVDYVLGENEQDITQELDAVMTELSDLASIAVYGIYDFPEDMNPEENIKTVESISMEETLELNKEFIQVLSSDFDKLSVESVQFFDIEMYEEEEHKDMFGVMGVADIVMNDIETELFLKVVIHIDSENLPRLFTVIPYDNSSKEE